MTLEQRLASYLARDEATGCINFTGTRNGRGYGTISVNGHGRRAHRVAYELAKGPIPDGLVIDHLCKNTSCCNPDHLEAVTQRENILRGDGFAAVLAARDHCPNGHAYAGQNVREVIKADGTPYRVCVICRQQGARDYRARKEAARIEARAAPNEDIALGAVWEPVQPNSRPGPPAPRLFVSHWSRRGGNLVVYRLGDPGERRSRWKIQAADLRREYCPAPADVGEADHGTR